MLGRLTVDVDIIWNGDYSGSKLPANSKRTAPAPWQDHHLKHFDGLSSFPSMAPARYETEMTAEPIRTEGDWPVSWLM